MNRIDRALLVLALAAPLLAGCGAGGANGANGAGSTADGTAGAAAAGGFRGTVLPRPLPKIDFTLTDTEGEPYDFQAETDGYLTLLFFGYTHCPDVCPVHLANLAAVVRGLPVQTRKRIKVVFVTVDPARDSSGRIREWLDAMDPDFIGLRGGRAQVDSIMASLRLPAAVPGEPDEKGEYTVGHASQIIAFTPDGMERVIYAFGTRQTDWAWDLPRLVEIGSAPDGAAAAVPAAPAGGARPAAAGGR